MEVELRDEREDGGMVPAKAANLDVTPSKRTRAALREVQANVSAGTPTKVAALGGAENAVGAMSATKVALMQQQQQQQQGARARAAARDNVTMTLTLPGATSHTPILKRRQSMGAAGGNKRRVSFGGQQIKVYSDDPAYAPAHVLPLRAASPPVVQEDEDTVTFTGGLPLLFVDEDVQRAVVPRGNGAFHAADADATETVRLSLGADKQRNAQQHLQNEHTGVIEMTYDFRARLAEGPMGSRTGHPELGEACEGLASPGDITLSLPSLSKLVENEEEDEYEHELEHERAPEHGSTEKNIEDSDSPDSFDRMYGQVFGSEPTEDDLHYNGDITAALPNLSALADDEDITVTLHAGSEIGTESATASVAAAQANENDTASHSEEPKSRPAARRSDITGSMPSLAMLMQDASATCELSPIAKVSVASEPETGAGEQTHVESALPVEQGETRKETTHMAAVRSDRRKSIMANMRRMSSAATTAPLDAHAVNVLGDLGSLNQNDSEPERQGGHVAKPVPSRLGGAMDELASLRVAPVVADDMIQALPNTNVAPSTKSPEADAASFATGAAVVDLAASPARSSEGKASARVLDFDVFLEVANVRFLDNVSTRNRDSSFGANMEADLMATGAQDGRSSSALLRTLDACLVVSPDSTHLDHACGELEAKIGELEGRIRQQVDAFERSQNPLFARALQMNQVSSDNDALTSMQVTLRRLKNFCRHQAKHAWHQWRQGLEQKRQDGFAQMSSVVHQDTHVLKTRHAELELEREQLHAAQATLDFEFENNLKPVAGEETLELAQGAQDDILTSVQALETELAKKACSDSARIVALADLNSREKQITDLANRAEELRKMTISDEERRAAIDRMEETILMLQRLSGLSLEAVEPNLVTLVLESALRISVVHENGAVRSVHATEVDLGCSMTRAVAHLVQERFAALPTRKHQVSQIGHELALARRFLRLCRTTHANASEAAELYGVHSANSLSVGVSGDALVWKLELYLSSLSYHTKLAITLACELSMHDVYATTESPQIQRARVRVISGRLVFGKAQFLHNMGVKSEAADANTADAFELVLGAKDPAYAFTESIDALFIKSRLAFP
ncbi:hypothetical protein FVE85_9843 [Porphyridium purpureum]|uniref:Spc7 kinetochore protein domain-containing protein n=1 Tax=Porphyridium purpureum TaxID=35688 RepID=A0A5J4YHR0_PORPP|nr:hypothetical protein FVE85_9843 [Porphyridium purpureum]|eukprot:POR6999..scf289_17